MIKDVGAVYSKNGVEIKVGFENVDFHTFSHKVLFRFPGSRWHVLGGHKVSTSDEARELIGGIFKECTVGNLSEVD